MTEDVNISRSWKSVARSDADIDLLQRSISHVENLLSRLEYGPVPTPQGSNGAGGSGIAAVAAGSQTTARAQADGSSSATGLAPPAAHADALRITLEAHEEAYRIRAQAAAVHAKAVAESERLLGEAQQLCEQLRADAISEAAARADKLHAAARPEADATERDARKRLDTAVAEVAAEADAVRVLVHDTFSQLVQRLSEALECLQRLTTAIRPDAPLASALTERRHLPDAPGDPVPDAGFSPGAIDGSPAAVSSGEGVTAAGAHMPIISDLAGPTFRITRR